MHSPHKIKHLFFNFGQHFVLYFSFISNFFGNLSGLIHSLFDDVQCFILDSCKKMHNLFCTYKLFVTLLNLF